MAASIDATKDTSVPRCHFNHAGASPSPSSVIQRIVDYMELEQKLGGYAAEATVQDELEQVYQNVASFIHADSASEIALVESATVAWTRAFYSMAYKKLDRKNTPRTILISDAEYAANVVAACQWAREHEWIVLSIPSETANGENTGTVDLAVLDDMLLGRYTFKGGGGESKILDPASIALVCITHIPTNSGIVNPVEEIGEKISAYNEMSNSESAPPIFYLVDACQSVGQMDVNVNRIHCHALVATGRKYLRGPRGTGFLYVSSSVVDGLVPSHIDHYGVPILKVPTEYQDGDNVANTLQIAPRAGASRFEFWESNIGNRLGLGTAICVAMEKGLLIIQGDCEHLAKILRDRLGSIKGVNVHHATSSSCGIVTFFADGLDAAIIKEELWLGGFELSIVPATSTPLDSSKTRVSELVRASLSYTSTEMEIDRFCDTLSFLLKRSSSRP
jgi:cysteine desulfurase/selenocysteine lyase